jgi:signal transduction histidine kinase
MSASDPIQPDQAEDAEASRLFARHLEVLQRYTDRIFAVLLILQWLAMILIALTISPRIWAGSDSAIHPHVLGATLVGAAIISLPLLLIIRRPGSVATRHVVAVAQALSSALLIHLTGGRIETHFHVFGSLAFIAFYRDYRVLITASAVVSLDHWLRGMWWPQSVYGVLEPDGWRWLEHVGWVVFEDAFLIIFIRQSISHIREISLQRAREVSDRRRLLAATAEAEAAREAVQAHAEVLTRVNSDLQQFAYVASHDLKEPLRMVVQYLEVLDLRIGPGLDGEHRRYLTHAIEGGCRMQRLINDLLAYTRISDPRDAFIPVDLNDVIAHVRESLSVGIAEQDAVIEVERLPTVVGSASLLGLLFQNLLANALKFHEDRPLLIRIACDHQADAWRILVSDNGIGVDPAHYERIFQVFQRLHHEKRYPGTGIGLAISRKIVHQHGGTIAVRPTTGGGTTFVISLPRAAPASAKTVPLPDAP